MKVITINRISGGEKTTTTNELFKRFPNSKALYFDDLDYVFLDYPFGYMQRQISKFISFSIFIDTPLDIALVRRMLRDYKNKSVN